MARVGAIAAALALITILGAVEVATGQGEASRCNLRQVSKDKWVCVCDESSCDEIVFDWPQESGQAVLVVSSKSGKRLQVMESLEQEQGEDNGATGAQTTIGIDLSDLQQTILGWGGAFTDSAALNVYNLSSDLSRRLIESYFGENGLQYSMGRVPIAGSDFSTRKYTYAEVENDFELKHWTLAPEDTDYKIPMIREAIRLCEQRGARLKLFASPWSAPAWMKTSRNLVRGSLIDRDEIYRAYAEYLMKFYRAYREHGIEFWGATIQNEPFAAYLPIYFFNSMSYTPGQMIKFVSQFLGPALEAEGMTRDSFKLIVGDDSLGFVDPLVTRVMANPEARKYIAGLAFHWYTSGSIMSYTRLTKLYAKLKDDIEFVMMSEACNGYMPLDKKTDLGSWDRGEAYALDIIEDLLRHTGAWIDWNLALDEKGGPNWANNLVDSPIIVDSANNQFFKQPMYYVLGHFSRFLRPGSIRVATRLVVVAGGGGASNVDVVAVRDDESGHLVANILNRANKNVTINLSVEASGHRIRAFSSIPIEAKSINSIILKL